ncbi:MAG: prepilin-type N-terminal cleavage/methylation domain-containing protein [Bacilli bacterium]|nr:prepilin-type N-terminal cleavage/methylation domain-containing protein [Bacilli bacterium]
MKVFKNKKGFTLVELLVAISIMGIIMVIALPQISNIQQSNKKTKYKKYAESMLSSAKLYTDSYTEDMFGNNTSGCVDVLYADLKDKDLLKDIKVDGSTCSSEDTFVRIRKANDHYFYDTSIYCTDKNRKVVYDERLTRGACEGEGPDVEGPKIKITPNSKGWTKGTDEKITIKIWDEYGMLENAKVRLTWTKDGVAYGTPTEVSFKNKRYDGESEENAIKHEITVPQNETGIFVLTVSPVDVRDSLGNYILTNVVSGEYKLDNQKPIITGHTNDSDSVWVNRDVKITAQADDYSRSGIKQIYYYYTETDKKTDWDTQSPKSSVVGTWTAERNQEVFVIAKDYANNYSDPVSVGYVKIDKTKPEVSNVTNTKKNTWTNGNVAITATAADKGSIKSGIDASYYYYTETDKKTDWDSDSTATSIKGTWSAERNQEVFIITKDKAGNYSDPVSAGKVMIDKTEPVVTGISNPKNGVKTIAGLQVTLSGEERGTTVSGISKWQYKEGSGSWTDIANSGYSPYVDTFTQIRAATTFSYRICDVAGNCSDSQDTVVEIVEPCSSTTAVNCGAWAWSDCTATCGGGTQYESRTCSLASAYDESISCPGTTTQTRNEGYSCNAHDCCGWTWTDWGEWGGCDATCGWGNRYKYGTKYSHYNNQDCGSDSTYEACDAGSCEPPPHEHDWNCRDTQSPYGVSFKWDCTAGHKDHTSAFGIVCCTCGAAKTFSATLWCPDNYTPPVFGG